MGARRDKVMLQIASGMCLLLLDRLRHYVSLFDSISKLVYVRGGQKDTNDLTELLFLKIQHYLQFRKNLFSVRKLGILGRIADKKYFLLDFNFLEKYPLTRLASKLINRIWRGETLNLADQLQDFRGKQFLKFFFVLPRFKISLSLLYTTSFRNSSIIRRLKDSQSVPTFCLDNPLGTQHDISSFSTLLSFLLHVIKLYYFLLVCCSVHKVLILI